MKYEQATGKLYDVTTLIGLGWAGHLDGKNNTAMEGVKGIGPLPRGSYSIGDPEDGTHLGPLAFPLTPDPSNKMFGRSAFFIHGADIENPAMSSDGCIIMPRPTRELLSTKIGGSPSDSPLRQLIVY